MTLIGWLQAAAVFFVVILCVRPLGTYMAQVFEGEYVFLSPLIRPIEVGLV